MSESRYFMTIVGLFPDEILSQEDLDLFDEEVKVMLLGTVKLFENDPE